MSEEKNYGPIWQLKENAKSKHLLIKSHTADIERMQKLLSKTMEELAEYEVVLAKLGETA